MGLVNDEMNICLLFKKSPPAQWKNPMGSKISWKFHEATSPLYSKKAKKRKLLCLSKRYANLTLW